MATSIKIKKTSPVPVPVVVTKPAKAVKVIAAKPATPAKVAAVTPPKKPAKVIRSVGLLTGKEQIGTVCYAVNQSGEMVKSIIIGVDFDLSGETPTLRKGWFATLATDPNSGDFARIYTYPTDLLYTESAKGEAMKAAKLVRDAREAKRRARNEAMIAKSIAASRGEEVGAE